MKTISNRHSIKALLFDIIFDDERRAGELYEDVRQLHYLELEKVISRCLDQFVGPGEFAQLKVLELDLGKIHYRDLNGQLAQKLYAALTEKLRLIFSQDPGGDQSLIAPAWTRMDLVRHYLEEAYLPWNTQQDAGTLFLEALSREPASLAEALRQIGHSETVRRRLVTRFGSTEVMGKLILALQPENGAVVLQFHSKLCTFLKAQKNFEINAHQLEKNVWLLILDRLLAQNHPISHNRILFKAVLLRFAEKHQLSFDGLIRAFRVFLKPSQEAEYSRLRKIISELFTALRQRSDRPEEPVKKFVELSIGEQNQVLWDFLRTELVDPQIKGWDPVRLQEHFQWLLREHPATVIRFLKERDKTAEPISVLVRHFNRQTITGLVRVLDGSHYHLIDQYHGHVLAIHRKEPLVMNSEKSFSGTLWELILILLINRSGSHFNQKVFLKQLIRQLSARYNLNFYQLISQFYQVADTLSGQTNRLPQFVRLIAEIHEDEKILTGRLTAGLETSGSGSDHKEIDQKYENNQKQEGSSDPLKLWKQYLRSPLSPQDFTMLRRYIWRTLPVQAEPILQEIKEPHLISDLLGRLTNDFEVVFIHLFVRSIEPAHFHSILDYQKQIIRVQKSEPILRTSELELSNALWTLILKLLLSRASSHFNRKAFLKQLLLQTAAHYNSDYIVLLDQLCKAAQLAQSTSPDLQAFLHLVKEIRNDMKTGSATETKTDNQAVVERATETSPMIPSDSGPGDLIDLVIRFAPDQVQLLRKRGFTDLEEAIGYLRFYHRAALMNQLEKHQLAVRRAFISKLSADDTEHLLQSASGNRTESVRQLLRVLEQRMEPSVAFDRQAVMHQCRQEALLFVLDRKTPSFEHLLINLEKVLDGYPLPDSFFAGPEAWKVPANGQLDHNIIALENRIKRSIEQEQGHLSRTKKVLEEALDKTVQPSEGIVYRKIKEDKEMPEIYISNGGLVILQAYLSYFFERCELTNGEGFVSADAQRRAALLLQYVFDPESHLLEEDLVLNKLLCGLPLREVLPSVFEATELEREVSGQLLDAIISHWELIKNSSQEGFRESWLQRAGKLSRKEKHWELLIEQRPFDVLLDYKPFSISPLQFSWMEVPIKVIWR